MADKRRAEIEQALDEAEFDEVSTEILWCLTL
jgi:hypothetical protein